MERQGGPKLRETWWPFFVFVLIQHRPLRKKTWPTGTNACHCKYEKEEANQMQRQAEMGGVGVCLRQGNAVFNFSCKNFAFIQFTFKDCTFHHNITSRFLKRIIICEPLISWKVWICALLWSLNDHRCLYLPFFSFSFYVFKSCLCPICFVLHVSSCELNWYNDGWWWW